MKPIPLLACLALSCASAALAERDASPEDRPGLEHYNLGSDGLALAGYDPISYFPEGGGEPREGEPELALRHRGIVYRFATPANRERFEAAPDGYEPSYGGWCAYAMVKGDEVEVDPKSFLIEDGKLRLFYDSFFSDTRKKWQKEGPAELAARADREWAAILEPPKQL